MSEFDFHNGMIDCLQASLTAAVAEVNRLRAANKTLRADLEAVPVEMWELQEQVTSLELQLASARGRRLDGSMIPAQPFTQDDQ